MSLSLDHIFIITSFNAPAAVRLAEFGFTEGNANVHPGQGTANRRFFLNGFTIELLYISDKKEALHGAGRNLGLLARSESIKASPFGLVVRVDPGVCEPDFPGWLYTPDYFDGNMSFLIGENSDNLNEPLCICMPPSLPVSAEVPAQYANPDWRLTGLDIDVPVNKLSGVLAHFATVDRVRINHGKPHHMTMTFNHGSAGQNADLLPDLPLLIKY